MSKDILGIFNETDVENIRSLIEELENSSFEYLKLEGNGVKIVIGKNGVADVDEVSTPKTEVSEKPDTPAIKEEKGLDESVVEENTNEVEDKGPEKEVKETVQQDESLHIIKAPSYGLFYAQPEPGAPPYVKEGDTVQEGDTIGLLEVMKTYTAIVSDVDGEIVEIHVENEEQLEPDKPLFSVKIK